MLELGDPPAGFLDPGFAREHRAQGVGSAHHRFGMAREQFEEPVLPWHEPLEQSERPELPGNRRRRGKRGDRQTGGRLGRRNEASDRSEEHTSELQSLMRNSYAVFCLKKKKK